MNLKYRKLSYLVLAVGLLVNLPSQTYAAGEIDDPVYRDSVKGRTQGKSRKVQSHRKPASLLRNPWKWAKEHPQAVGAVVGLFCQLTGAQALDANIPLPDMRVGGGRCTDASLMALGNLDSYTRANSHSRSAASIISSSKLYPNYKYTFTTYQKSGDSIMYNNDIFENGVTIESVAGSIYSFKRLACSGKDLPSSSDINESLDTLSNVSTVLDTKIFKPVKDILSKTKEFVEEKRTCEDTVQAVATIVDRLTGLTVSQQESPEKIRRIANMFPSNSDSHVRIQVSSNEGGCMSSGGMYFPFQLHSSSWPPEILVINTMVVSAIAAGIWYLGNNCF